MAPSRLLAVTALFGAAALAQQPAPKAAAAAPAQSGYTFSATTELVLIDLAVHDKKGNFIRDLKPGDVTVFEDGKPQTLESFELEDLPESEAGFERSDAAVKPAPTAAGAGTPAKTSPEAYHDRRLLVFYLDFTAMDPLDAQHAVETVQDYVKNQMQPADLVSVAYFADRLTIPAFTSDKDQLLDQLDDLHDGVDAPEPDSLLSLEALARLCDGLKSIQQKKSVVLLSDGIGSTRDADDMREYAAVTRAAIKANVVLNTWDARGLQVTSSVREIIRQQNSRDIINGLAVDTGGHALFDENEPTPLYTQIQKDTATYYLLSYRTANPKTDGKFRRLEVKVNRPGVELSYRSGYGAPKDWAHFTAEDRKQQMEDQLGGDFPERSFSLRANGGMARVDRENFRLTITLRVPSAQVTTTAAGKEMPSLDFSGMVLDGAGDDMADLGGTLKINPANVPETLVYLTGCTLPPGSYKLRFAARDNLTGKLASVRTIITLR